MSQNFAASNVFQYSDAKLRSFPIKSGPSAFHVFSSSEQLIAFKTAEAAGKLNSSECEYGRYRQIEWTLLEKELAALEEAESAASFPSGMAAITAVFEELCPSTEKNIHIIASAQGYRKTRSYLGLRARSPHFELTLLQPEQYAELEKYIKPNTALIFAETPSNPFLRVVDITRISAICRKRNIPFVVDHTFSSPFNVCPIALGADLVTVSATKYHGGRNDLLAGYVAGSEGLIKRIVEYRGTSGSIPSAESAWKLRSYLSDFGDRMKGHNRYGLELARRLESSSAVRRVWYPGLASHPDYQLAKSQLRGFAGVVSCELQGTLESTARFLDALLRTGSCCTGPSFGGEITLVTHVPIISHYSETKEQRSAQGISDTLLRFSIAPKNNEFFFESLESALHENEECVDF